MAAGLAAVATAGATVSAGAFEMPQVTPASQTVQGGAEFTVTYAPCLFPEELIRFEFSGQVKEVFCDGGTNGVEALAAPSATATFTAPETAGTYTGIAYSAEELDLRQGFRGPVAPETAAIRPAQAPAPTCEQRFRCASFSVTVPAPPPSSTTTTTTVAPATTVAATTTAADVGAGAVTVAPTLPATGPSQNDNTATIAIALLVAGGAMLLMTRRRTAS
ncbi:MAG TPA: LPXTG cell wall anchor domain-containing protein [Ilumatobacteraceae bacterium]|nr:LPXTG cell wall anchor domain-containing protein [Ilumatobacteraceae bacterium]